MRSFFGVLDQAAKELKKSPKLRETYVLHANLRGQLESVGKEWHIIKQNAQAKNISLINDSFRENIIANLRNINRIIETEINEQKIKTDNISADVLLPCHIAVVKYLLTEEFGATVDKQTLKQKIDTWLDYLDCASIGINDYDGYLLTQFSSALVYLKDQWLEQYVEQDVVKEQIQGEAIAIAVIEKMKQGVLIPVQPDIQLKLDYFPLFRNEIIIGTDYKNKIDESEKQRRLKACNECLKKLANSIDLQRQALSLSIGGVSDLIAARKHINTILDNDLKQYAIIYELKNKLIKSKSPTEAIAASNKLVRRRWSEIASASNAKYPILERLKRIFLNWISPVKPNFFAAIHEVEKGGQQVRRNVRPK